MWNLTHFIDRLITDGKYKIVQLVYDDNDPLIKDTNFIPELTELASGKYAMFIGKHNYLRPPSNTYKMWAFTKHIDMLKIFTLNFNVNGPMRFVTLLNSGYIMHGQQNIILLIPTQSDRQKSTIFSAFHESDILFKNISVIFYQMEKSPSVDSISKKSIEIFALNYKIDKRGNHRADEEKSVYKGSLNESNLHDKIFGSISKKPNLIIHTITASKESMVKTSVQQANTTLINLGSADYYLSNFIARNLRAKDALVQQVLLHEIFVNGQSWMNRLMYNCSASNERVYGELYNLPVGKRRDFSRFVFKNFMSCKLAGKLVVAMRH